MITLLRPGGVESVAAENLILRQQLIVIGRTRKRFHRLTQTVQEEAALEHDKAMMGLLYHIGFRRGEDFNPNEQQRAILEDAVRAAQSWLIGKMENNDAFGAPFWPDRTYRTLSFTPDVIEGGAQLHFHQ
jgi:hypothetical protein